MSEKKNPKVEPADDIEILDLDIDIDQMVIDDLEMLSKIDAIGMEAVPFYKVIEFMKRVAGDDIGQRFKVSELQPVMKAIFGALQEHMNPEDMDSGKN